MEVDYKQNYTNLKRKLKFMVYVSINASSNCQWRAIIIITPISQGTVIYRVKLLYFATCLRLGAGVFSGRAQKIPEEAAQSVPR